MCVAVLQISAGRLEEVRQELGSLIDELQPLQLRYDAEKRRLDELRSLQQKQQDLQAKLDQAEYRMDQVTAADIKYASISLTCLHHFEMVPSSFIAFAPLPSKFAECHAGQSQLLTIPQCTITVKHVL